MKSLVVHGCGLVLACTVWQAHAGANYDSLVLEARSGNQQPLLNWLAGHEKSLDISQQADRLQVANWAGDDPLVVDVWQQLSNRRVIPERGVLAVARSYRNLGLWPESLELWQRILKRNPGQQEARAGWIMTLSDSAAHNEARQQAERFVRDSGSFLSHQVFLYVVRARGNGWDELFALTQLHDLTGDTPGLEEERVRAMAALQIASPALQLSAGLPLNEQARRQLELDQLAEMVRVAHTSTRGEKEQHWIADRALERYQVLLQEWDGIDGAEEQILLARTDRMGALLVRNRFVEVIDEYEDMQAAGHVMPDYAQRWAASAYLSARQPDTALQIMDELFRGIPPAELPLEDSHEMFFAAMESERIERGGAMVDAILKDTPYHLYHYGSPTPQPNDSWLSGQVLHGHYLYKSNQLDMAEQKSRRMAYSGPGNQGLRINYAEILLARGLPRAAEHELKLAEVNEPDNLRLEQQQAYVAQALQEWQQFDLLVDDVVQRSSEDPATRQLARYHQVENMHEFRLEGSKGISSGSPVSGSHDLNLRAALYAPRQFEHWRPFVAYDYSTGRFDEGKGHNRIVAAGVEYTSRNNWAELEFSSHRARGGNRLGARLAYQHDFSDHWSAGTELERLSRQTPLRAIRNGVTANRGGLSLRWYQNERREYQANVARSHFSDGNNRMEYGISGKERLYSKPYLTLDLLPSIGMSTNSKRDVPYYNPKRDFHVMPTLLADHVLYRRYEQAWRQQFMAGAGGYWQKGYSTGSMLTAGYGQRYQNNSVLDAGAMLIWSKQPYDGKREHDLSLVFDVNYRF